MVKLAGDSRRKGYGTSYIMRTTHAAVLRQLAATVRGNKFHLSTWFYWYHRPIVCSDFWHDGFLLFYFYYGTLFFFSFCLFLFSGLRTHNGPERLGEIFPEVSIRRQCARGPLIFLCTVWKKKFSRPVEKTRFVFRTVKKKITMIVKRRGKKWPKTQRGSEQSYTLFFFFIRARLCASVCIRVQTSHGPRFHGFYTTDDRIIHTHTHSVRYDCVWIIIMDENCLAEVNPDITISALVMVQFKLRESSTIV